MQTIANDPRKGWTSASNAEPDSLCVGRHLKQKEVTESEQESEAAERGTRIHLALATEDTTKLSVAETEMVDSCRAIEQKLLAKVFGDDILKFKAVPKVEQRFWIQNKDGLCHSGQADRIFRKGDTALIVDYKSGRSEVKVSSSNLQLRDLAVLYWKSTQLITRIAVAVVQPLVTHSPEITVYTLEDLQRAAVEMEKRIIASNTVGQPLTPGEVQCKYCRAKAICLPYQQWSTRSLAVPKSIVDVPVKEWTPEQFALFLEREPIARKWLDLGYDAAKSLLEKGGSIPGYGLKPGMVRDVITNPQTVFERFSEKGGGIDGFMACIAVGKTKLREALGKAAGIKGKALDQAMDEVLAGCVEEKQSANQIVKL